MSKYLFAFALLLGLSFTSCGGNQQADKQAEEALKIEIDSLESNSGALDSLNEKLENAMEELDDALKDIDQAGS